MSGNNKYSAAFSMRRVTGLLWELLELFRFVLCCELKRKRENRPLAYFPLLLASESENIIIYRKII